MPDFSNLPEHIAEAFKECVDYLARYPAGHVLGSRKLTEAIEQLSEEDTLLEDVLSLMMSLSDELEAKWYPVYQKWLPEKYIAKFERSGRFQEVPDKPLRFWAPPEGSEKDVKVVFIGGVPDFPIHHFRKAVDKVPVVVVDDVPSFDEPLGQDMVFDIHRIEMPPEIKEAARKKKHWETGKFYDKFYNSRKKRGR